MTPEEQITRLKDVIGLLIKGGDGDDKAADTDKETSAALHDVIAAKARERINPPFATPEEETIDEPIETVDT